MKHRWYRTGAVVLLFEDGFVFVVRCRRCGWRDASLPTQSRHRWVSGSVPPSCLSRVVRGVMES